MSTFIDRDPQELMRYARDARNIIDEMTLLIRKTEGLLDAYASDLDETTQKQIQELHSCCSEYFKQIEGYRRIADEIYSKGKRLNDLRNGER